jgi:hypothetical protein
MLKREGASQMIESLFFDFKCLSNFSENDEIKMAQTAGVEPATT